MSIITLEAQSRKVLGKGASRRLRRLDNMVPAIVYGGDEAPQNIQLQHNKLQQALEVESIYSSVFDLHIDGKVSHVILKSLQRHPYKPVILHMDLQRVSSKDILVKMVPLHFLNEEASKGVKAGGRINHTLKQVEVRCQANALPEFIEVDLANLNLNDVVHLSDLKLPKGVSLTVDCQDPHHNLPIVNIHAPKGQDTEEEAEAPSA